MQLLLPPNQTLCYAASFNLCNKNELIFRLSGSCDTCFELLLTCFYPVKGGIIILQNALAKPNHSSENLYPKTCFLPQNPVLRFIFNTIYQA